MHWLQLDIELENNSSFDSSGFVNLSLPCPTDDLLQMVDAAATGDAAFERELNRTLRTNPSMMLFVLHRFHAYRKSSRAYGNEVEADVRTLLMWCHECLLAELSWQKFAPAHLPESGQRLVPPGFWNAFLRQRKASKLRKSLFAWVLEQADELRLSKRQLRKWLKSIFPNSLCVNDLQCRGVRKPRTRRSAIAKWSQSVPTKASISRLMKMAIKHCESTIDFERHLLIEKMAAMKGLAYGASHEINNPLANIATRAQTMLVDETHAEKRHKLSVIYQQAMRAHEMISDMMLFAHPPALKIKNVSLRLLMSKFLNQCEASFDLQHIDVRVVLGAGVDRVSVDPTQLLVALACLVKNSAEAIAAKPSGEAEGALIEVKVAAVNGQLEFGISDDGIGVDPGLAKHIFDPFYSSREAGRGLGFGLSKVWRIVTQHGGDIQLDNCSEPGTRFVVRLPSCERTLDCETFVGTTTEEIGFDVNASEVDLLQKIELHRRSA